MSLKSFARYFIFEILAPVIGAIIIFILVAILLYYFGDHLEYPLLVQ